MLTLISLQSSFLSGLLILGGEIDQHTALILVLCWRTCESRLVFLRHARVLTQQGNLDVLFRLYVKIHAFFASVTQQGTGIFP
jgi:hypothetical protein